MTSFNDRLYLVAQHADIAALRLHASRVRDQHWGREISYSRKVFIPLTTMCRNTCGYCVFVKHPDHPMANYLTPEEVHDYSFGIQ